MPVRDLHARMHYHVPLTEFVEILRSDPEHFTLYRGDAAVGDDVLHVRGTPKKERTHRHRR